MRPAYSQFRVLLRVMHLAFPFAFHAPHASTIGYANRPRPPRFAFRVGAALLYRCSSRD